MLALLGYLRDPSRGPDEVRRQCPTFSEWLKPSDANPVTYEALTPELLTYLRGTGAIFARKFRADTVSADHWDSVVRGFEGAAGAGKAAAGKAASSWKGSSGPRQEGAASSGGAASKGEGGSSEGGTSEDKGRTSEGGSQSREKKVNTSSRKEIDSDGSASTEPSSKRSRPDI